MKLKSALYFCICYYEIFGFVLKRFQYQLSVGDNDSFCLLFTVKVTSDYLCNPNISSYSILVTFLLENSVLKFPVFPLSSFYYCITFSYCFCMCVRIFPIPSFPLSFYYCSFALMTVSEL